MLEAVTAFEALCIQKKKVPRIQKKNTVCFKIRNMNLLFAFERTYTRFSLQRSLQSSH